MSDLIVQAWDTLPSEMSWKDKVRLLSYLSLNQLVQVKTPVSHLFETGMYIREMRIPANVIFTGREHLLGHKMELIEGSVIVIAPDGKFWFDAYASMDTKPGFHAVVYTLTDVVARTVHSNPEESRNTEALEKKWFGEAEPVIEQGRLLYEKQR